MSLLVAVVLVLAATAAVLLLLRRRRPPDVQPVPDDFRPRRPIPAPGAGAGAGAGADATSSLRDFQPVRRTQRTDTARVRRGAKLGDGGQGDIYEIVGDPDRVLKELRRPVPAARETFAAILDARELIAGELRGLPIALCWPERLEIEKNFLLGYVMPRIEADFYFTSLWRRRTKRRVRDLQHAIPRQSVFEMPFAVQPDEAMTLLRLVACFLDAMHRHNLIYDDISWFNFAFALDPVRLCVFDFDSTRPLGTDGFTAPDAVNTIDWDDPEASHERDPEDLEGSVATLDSDRYKFALLAYRMLIAKDRHSRFDHDGAAAAAAGLRNPDLQALWQRAAGSRGTRPQLSEWVRALSPATHAVDDVHETYSA